MKFYFLLALLTGYFSLLAQSSSWDDSNSTSVKFYNYGEFKKAIQWADRALLTAEKEFGKSSNQYITSLENKTYGLAALGEYLEAIKLSRQAVKLSFNLHKKPHALHIETLHSLTKSHLNLGRYDSAESLLNEINYLISRLPKENKVHYDSSIWRISDSWVKVRALEAILYHRKGQIDKAITVMEEQLVWIQDLYPDEYESISDYQTTLNNLGTYYNEVLEFDKSKAYALRYLHLLNAHNGKPLDKVNALQNLGSLYRSTENYDSAFYYLNSAMSEIEKQENTRSNLYIILLNNIGTLYLDIDQRDSALVFLKKAKNLQDAQSVFDPRIYKNTLYNLAEAYRWSGKYEQADEEYSKLIRLIIDDVNRNFTYLSDAEKLSFYKGQLQFINDYKSFALEISGLLPLQDSDEPYVDPEIAGRLYNLQLSTKAIILNASKRMRNNIINSGDTALISAFTHWEFTKNLLANQLNDQYFTDKAADSLKQIVEFYEKWLITNSSNFRAGFQQEEITWKDVRNQLSEGEASVELVRLVDGLAYAAVIVTPKTVEQPDITLILGKNMKYLEEEFFANYHNAMIYQQKDTISYDVYWQPIFKSIKASLGKSPSKIYLSNDGIYNQINLNTLYNADTDEFVLDETEIHLLTNTKELLSASSESNDNRTAILLGDPEFAMHRAKGYSFTPLPGAGEEVEAIDKILKNADWKSRTFKGNKASEQQLNSLKEPGILHIASHGYFKPHDPQADVNFSQMLNSGLVLATDGINADGFLTAYEVMTHNYDATKLVVLSACETGLGAVNNGEGVYGLQRALQVAGANNIIMSLWKVDDQATKLLMTSFYKYLTKENDVRIAFSKAQKEIRKIYPHPYYWGAFVLAGK